MKDSNLLCVSTNIEGLMAEIGIKYESNEWRLFIDGSTSSLKVVLLHNGNQEPSIPLTYSTEMKEDYNNMKIILDSLNYRKYKWKICADLKVIGILLGLQGGYTKYCCFLCLWDSRAKKLHYKKKNWPDREWRIGKEEGENVLYPPLVDPDDVSFIAHKVGAYDEFRQSDGSN